MFGFSKKKEIESLFSQFVRPELIEAMKSPDFNPPLNELSAQRISYLVIGVDGPTTNDIGKHIGAIVDVAKEGGWFGDFLFSNLIVLIDGVSFPNSAPPCSRIELLAKLTAELKMNIKSIGGEQTVPWGSYGSPRRKVFGAMLPEFIDIVSQLNQLPFGSHAERNSR